MFSAERTAINQEQDPIIRSYDFDGVVTLGICPTEDASIIVTGRTEQEGDHVDSVLKEMGVSPFIPVHLNPVPKTIRERWHSAVHKASVLLSIPRHHDFLQHHVHFDDDILQIEVMKEVIEKAYTGELYELPNSIWSRLCLDGQRIGDVMLVEPGSRPLEIFPDYQAQFLRENLEFVHVVCPWVKK